MSKSNHRGSRKTHKEVPCTRNALSVAFSSTFLVQIQHVMATITQASERCVCIVRTTSGDTDTFCASVPHFWFQVYETLWWMWRVRRRTGTRYHKEIPEAIGYTRANYAGTSREADAGASPLLYPACTTLGGAC